jgi:hypothetical protein
VDAFSFQVADADGKPWKVSVSFPGFQNPLQIGDAVSVQAFWGGGGFSPQIQSMTLRDASGSLLLYIGKGGSVGDLSLPDGMSAAAGKVLCEQSDTCGDWSAYDLAITAGEASVTVPYAGTSPIGAYRVTHGGFEQSTGGPTRCPDWFVAHVALAIERTD